MKVKSNLVNGILAGISIGLGGAAFLACENKVIGAFLFGLGLYTILLNNFALYTGRICYLYENKNKEYISMLLLSILGNLIGAVLIGNICALINPSMQQKALDMCTAKLELDYFVAFLKGFMCDIFVYLAVDNYKKHKSVLGIFLFVTTFILCGFEHSIADMYYFAVSGIVSFKSFLFILMVILGNSVGGLFIPLLLKIKGE